MYFQLPTEHYSLSLLLFLMLFIIRVSIFLPLVFLRVLRVTRSHLVLSIWMDIKLNRNNFDENQYI